MKTLITAIVGAALLLAVQAGNAAEIVVAGQRFEIPSRYTTKWVEQKAQRCIDENVTKVKTDRAVDLLIMSCVSRSLRAGDEFYKLED